MVGRSMHADRLEEQRLQPNACGTGSESSRETERRPSSSKKNSSETSILIFEACDRRSNLPVWKSRDLALEVELRLNRSSSRNCRKSAWH